MDAADEHVDAPAEDEVGTAALTPRQLEHLLDAVQAVGGQLRIDRVLERVVESARNLVGARYGALGVLDEQRHFLSQFIHVGMAPEDAERIGHLPHGDGILGLLIVDPQPIRLDDLSAHPDSFGFPPDHPPMKSFLGVPVLVRGQAFGNLYLTEKIGGGPFTESDEQLATALAAVAGVAIDNARLHARLSELLVVEDRERIARDLHDTVIQRIFATGLALQGLAGRMDNASFDRTDAVSRLEQCVDDLDDTVRHIRTTIFDLQRDRLSGPSIRGMLIDLVNEVAGTFDITASITFDGPIEALLGGDDPTLANHLLAVVREAVTNVGKHAKANRVEVCLMASDRITLTVDDDGRGHIGERAPGAQGLTNLESRARQLGGMVELGDSPRGGAQLTWSVPI